MTKRVQTRRSISITGDVYARLDTFCKNNGVSKSAVVQELLDEFLRDARKELIKAVAERMAKRRPPKLPAEIKVPARDEESEGILDGAHDDGDDVEIDDVN